MRLGVEVTSRTSSHAHMQCIFNLFPIPAPPPPPLQSLMCAILVSRASFEQTVEVFQNAAMFSESDVLNGVTENVMLGQLGRLGTGLVDLLLDDSKLHNVETIKDHEQMVEMEMPQTPNAAFTPFVQQYGGQTPSFIHASTPIGMFSPAYSPGGYDSPFSPRSPGGASPVYGATPGYAPGRCVIVFAPQLGTSFTHLSFPRLLRVSAQF